jgi:hypothetical protein
MLATFRSGKTLWSISAYSAESKSPSCSMTTSRHFFSDQSSSKGRKDFPIMLLSKAMYIFAQSGDKSLGRWTIRSTRRNCWWWQKEFRYNNLVVRQGVGGGKQISVGLMNHVDLVYSNAGVVNFSSRFLCSTRHADTLNYLISYLSAGISSTCSFASSSCLSN